ncbi:glycosyltransferase family 4 protein [Frigidibacter oleivorans]|uniref:glycosyltransferase family 4 protein n=1 Tax=Frigidibacter oleivorans TaxID=2487129 RepID=UPI000F8D28D2|nr:glycosyltransferase family 4 protein [Frigidibacter oleivorans]
MTSLAPSGPALARLPARAPGDTACAAGGTGPRKVMVIGSLAWSLVNFRLDLMRRMVAQGHRVLAVAPDIDPATRDRLAAEGIACAAVPMDRTGMNPLRDLATLDALTRLMRAERPDLVLSYTMKPILYGSLAARRAGVPGVHALFTGLGYAFTDEAPEEAPAPLAARLKRRAVRTVVVGLHRVALTGVTSAFCYNDQERRDIRRHRLIPARVPLHDVPGSGVDTARFAASPPPEGAVRFLFVGRLLRSKGLEVLARATAELRARGHAVTVDLLGPEDTNPDAIDPATLARWQAEGLFRHLGQTRDVAPYFRACSVFVLPSLLREGVPRTILEAMASGRAVITSDAPGCGETIRDGVQGHVVPRGDARALAAAMERYLTDPDLARRMGAAARALACARHDVHAVNRLLLTHMGLESATPPADREASAA